MATALALLAVVAFVDVLLCFALEPYGALSEVVWAEYRTTQDIDTVFAGTSTTSYGLSPYVFDKDLGLDSHSFNMATPGQTYTDTLTTLKQACSDHEIRRVVMLVGYESLLEVPYINASVAVTQAKCADESLPEAIADVGALLFNGYFFERQYSLAALFPWTYAHVSYTPQAIAANVRNRLECNVFEAGRRYQASVEPNMHYEGRGYAPTADTIEGSAKTNELVIHYPGATLVDETVESLRRVCAYCREQGVTLYVFGSPYTPTAILQYGSDYAQNMALVRNMAEEEGARFVDINMVRSELYDPQATWFTIDNVHLSDAGSQEVTRLVAQLVGRMEAGMTRDELRALAYDYDNEGWSAYCAAVDTTQFGSLDDE